MDRTVAYPLIAFSILVFHWDPATSALAPTNLHAIRAGPCSAPDDDTLITVSEMSIYTSLYDSSISGRFNISKDVADGWSVKVTMQKCQDIRNLATCDYFKTVSLVSAGCESANDADADEDDESEAELYNMFFRHTKPRLACPIKAGSYKLEGYPFQIADNYLTVSESKISTSVFGYTYKIEGFLQRLKVFCVETQLQLLYIREHGWASPSEQPAQPMQPTQPAPAPDDSGQMY